MFLNFRPKSTEYYEKIPCMNWCKACTRNCWSSLTYPFKAMVMYVLSIPMKVAAYA